ncbi:MAG: hypothetical protein JRI76_13550 [Deltaproteobacteria bacterium]|nr:hypothetical protein [Deltaproteobacteria bacterium]MBW2043033.1 hypothetical protein [Deltaproteobacteria bacterium]
MHEERKEESVLSIPYLEEQIREVDIKIAEIEDAVRRLSDEEAKLLARRAEKNSGDIEDIIARSRESQKRLQEIRDFIEIEQAPLAELKAKREEYVRQHVTLKRLKIKERMKALIQNIEGIQESLSSLKEEIDAMESLL